MRIGIVGIGHVGQAMLELFPDAAVYDGPKGLGSREAINECDVAFVCVPTPMREDGACETDVVDECIDWIASDVIAIRSTVPVGYTERKCAETGKRIVFQPEYYGETVAHPFVTLSERMWITLGGEPEDCDRVLDAYKTVYNALVQVRIVSARTAELAKYMENAYLAAKVIFCNEFYDLAQALGVDYNQLRETWLMDPRMGRSHTFVYKDNRGYGGSCLPKDLSSILTQANGLGVDTTLLSAVRAKNDKYHA